MLMGWLMATNLKKIDRYNKIIIIYNKKMEITFQ